MIDLPAPSMMAAPHFRATDRTTRIAFICLAVAWLVFSIGMRPLSLPEEGRYVGVAWEMLRSGDWIVPTENGMPFFHKPPLFYWLTAASLAVFDNHVWAARLAPLFGAIFGATTLYLVSKRWVGAVVARWSVIALLTQPFFFAGAQFANLDMLVAAFIAASILLAAHAALRMQIGEPHVRPLLGAWVAAALGVLSKGLIGIVLPALVLVAWLVATRQHRLILRLLWLPGIAAFLLVAAPWFIAVQMRHPEFFHFFFVYQHFERFSAGGFNNVRAWWFYLLVVPGLTLPWSLWLLRSGTLRRPVLDGGEAAMAGRYRWLLWIWLAVVLVFFSIPRSKPIGYAMPVLFPIAALAALAIAASSYLPRRRRAAPVCLGLALVVCVSLVIGYARFDRHSNEALATTLRLARQPGEPVVFVSDFFSDVPFYARLRDPVAVVSDWHDPAILADDNWRRELSEATPFDRKMAASVLIDDIRRVAPACGRPAWFLGKTSADARIGALPRAMRIATSNDVSLWRVDGGRCAAAP